jgi:lipopolysaccharide assembly outer membrane protein LptD (OstA)
LPRRFLAAGALSLAIAGAPAATAQEKTIPSPAPTPTAPVAAPTPHPGSTQAEVTAPPPAGACDPGAGDICLNAERQEQMSKELYRLTGFVDIQFGASRIQADRVDVHTSEKPGGGTQRRVVAEGNVVFMSGEERLSGTKLEMDLDGGKGVFENAFGFVSPGVMVEADRIERIDADTYKISGGKFTSCMQPNPRWSFTASSATLDVDKRIRAANVVFRVKEVPAFYIPYFLYPIESDQRSTGFLFPHFGQSSTRGFNIGSGFFWAMNRSMDQTFYVDHYSDYGYGLGHEFRYALPSPSRGDFRSYFFRRTVADDGSAVSGAGWEHDLQWSATQMLPGAVRANLGVSEVSTLDFQRDFQETLDRFSQRNRSWNLNLQRALGPANVQLAADSSDYFFGNADNFRRRRRLPSLRVTQSPRKIGRTGIVYQYDTRAERLSDGNQEGVEQYSRFDLFPRLSRPFSTTFLQINPQVVYRWTRYGAQREGGFLVETPLTRDYLESSVEMSGPSFSRIFENTGGFYSDRFKHVIGPQVTWTYRSKIDEFRLIPRFDGVDPVLGTNELRYGLVQRLYAKRPGETGKPEAYEFLRWDLFQTYYVDIAEGQNQFDPNYSSASYGRGGVPSHYSPLHSSLSVRPTPRLSTTLDLQYDVNFRELRSVTVSSRVDYRRLGLDARWSRGSYRGQDDEIAGEYSTVRGDLRLEVLPSRFSVQGSADYNFVEKEFVQGAVRARYDVQCCGFVAEMIQINYLARHERRFRFAIELANIGSIGNFTGQEASDRSAGFLGGRR